MGLTCEDCGRVARACRVRKDMATYWCADHYPLVEVMDQKGDDLWIVLPSESTMEPRR